MADYQTRIGHVHLKVRDLQGAVDFYTRYFQLKITEMVQGQYAFLSGSAMHHEVALQNVGADAPAAHSYGVGLYHVAFAVPDKGHFAQAYQALQQGGIRMRAVDHGISWAVYFSDPDGNGLEIYVDTRHDKQGRTGWHGLSLHLSDAQVLSHLP